MMDALEQFLGDGQKVSQPSIKPVNNPGNMRPVGGSGFQQFATPEEGIAAADKNLKVYGEKHGINTLRGVISRWAPPSDNNDTESYINTVAKKIGLDPNQKIDLSDPVQRHVLSGAMFTVEKGAKNLFKVGQQNPQTQVASTSNDPLEAFLSGKPIEQNQTLPATGAGAGRGSYEGFNPTEAQANAKANQPQGTAVGRAAAKLFGQVQEGKRALGERVVGAIDTAYGVVPAAYGAGVQALARTANTPERAAEIGRVAEQSIAQPVGKALGITGKETYQKPLGGITEPIVEQVRNMAEKMGLTAQQISEKTGIPEQDIKNMAVTASFALPQVFKEVAPVAKQAAGIVTKPIREAAAELQIVKPGTMTKEQAAADFAARQTKEGSVGAAAASNNPYLGKITGEEHGGSETFPQVKLTKIPQDVPVGEQQLRSQLFQEVLPGVNPRPGVVTGNDNLLRNEHALAAMAEPTPLGMKMKEQIAKEQIGLSKFAEDRVDATGASRSLINDEQRGQRINDVFHGVDPEDMSGASVNGYLNQAKREIYNSALEKQGSKQINTTHLDSFVNDPLEVSTFKAAGQGQLLEGAKELIDMARTTGFKMRDGTFLPPGSVASYDHVRKIFNGPKIWNRDRASFIRDINGAIDQDIAAVADPALYKLGDKIHKLEKDLFKSKGIDKIFGETDKNGVITSATALEKIPQKLNNMPKDQWRHVRDTLNELAQGRIRNAPEGMPPVPKELQDSARAAVAEIDGALAREVYKAGAGNVGEWSSKKTNNVMNSTIGQKIVETFPPEEVQKFHALNYVGQFTPGLKYEGAALQQRRVSLLEKGLPGMGASAGAAVGGFLGEGSPLAIGGGAFVGREIGSKLQTSKAAKAETKALKKMEKEMQNAAELGKQTGKNKIQDLSK
jgi:hypothetical protein